MKRIIKYLVVFGLMLVLPSPAQAVCPVCVVAVGAGLGLSRWLGIDDVISGLWIGGLLLAFTLWLYAVIKKKIEGGVIPMLIVLAVYVLTIAPLSYFGIIGHVENRLWGVDKLLFGIVGGTLLFWLATKLEQLLRKKNKGRVYVYYQKVIIPVAFLLMGSLAFYLLLS